MSPDADLDVWVPQNPADFGILVRVTAGPVGGIGDESFDLIVCTPRWVEAWIRQNGPLIGRHHLLVAEWNFDEVRDFLTRSIQDAEAPTWSELGEKLGRLGKWEFEDYRP